METYGVYGTARFLIERYVSYGKLYILIYPNIDMPRGQLKLTKEDKEWAKAVKERDGHKCVICGDTERLNAHHIIPRELHETKYDIQNGISICPKHHSFSREISAHNNPLAFIIWLGKNRPTQLNYLIELCEL